MNSARSRRLCIVGGSTRDPGGVESFCARALEALNTHWSGGEVFWVPADSAHLSPARLPRFLRALHAFRRANRVPIDVLWLNVANLPDLLFVPLAKALGIRVLVTLHLGANSRLQRSGVLRWLSRTLAARADRIALLFDGQDAEIELPANVPRSTIRTFLPPESFAPPREAATGPELRLIHAGRLSEGKGSLAIVDLCAALDRAGIPFTARIIGRGDEALMEALCARIETHGLEPRVALSDWLDGPALIAALGGADILVHLSRLDSFPLIVLEAMAAGTIPIAIDMAGVRAMTTAYDGHLVAPNAAVPGAEAWLESNDLADLRRRGAAMGARVREDYSWAACVATLAAAIDATRPAANA
ncbi:glycosyltransferase family 4 protein [Sphingomonas sp. H39-1-10]|uniref:glycosyltransferase family 4 protein n=1 Tax=Sphingomonas pollutisoli TaxID=3030829 RepID=UPI0023B99EC4|nr:glycosyltransferase family 4 protein [Sphingomonas pollutisoli]MDF0490645.1 glycosyltransferase family 4 protein [Sphingomonas pollutisoli]